MSKLHKKQKSDAQIAAIADQQVGSWVGSNVGTLADALAEETEGKVWRGKELNELGRNIAGTASHVIVNPKGGLLKNNGATPYYSIELPLGPTNTIVSMRIMIISLYSEESIMLEVGGYTYLNWGAWYIPKVTALTPISKKYTVKFGTSATTGNMVLLIDGLSQSHNICYVPRMILSHAGHDNPKWWDVGLAIKTQNDDSILATTGAAYPPAQIHTVSILPEDNTPDTITVHTSGVIPTVNGSVAGLITKPAGADKILSYEYVLVEPNGYILSDYRTGSGAQRGQLAINEITLSGYWDSISADMQGNEFRLTVIWSKA